MTTTATHTLPILTAVNDAFAAIRERHPEVPQVNIVIGGAGARRGGQVHGHFQADSWINPDFQGFDEGENDRDTVHEIFLSGESLERGGAAVLGTLIHEAAHALAYERGIKDTSNAGRYHNKKFAAVGHELGILLEQAGTIGWSSTRLSIATKIRYRDIIRALDCALVTYRLPDYSRAVKVRKRTKGIMDCACEKPVTVSLLWFEDAAARLTCNDCLEPFTIEEVD